MVGAVAGGISTYVDDVRAMGSSKESAGVCVITSVPPSVTLEYRMHCVNVLNQANRLASGPASGPALLLTPMEGW